ncbi:MAG: hypothetical protein EB168_10300 [Euryarchaeota archaeon]|nr:hypothetical protein [Euryarchaeota archaeon]
MDALASTVSDLAQIMGMKKGVCNPLVIPICLTGLCKDQRCSGLSRELRLQELHEVPVAASLAALHLRQEGLACVLFRDVVMAGVLGLCVS